MFITRIVNDVQHSTSERETCNRSVNRYTRGIRQRGLGQRFCISGRLIGEISCHDMGETVKLVGAMMRLNHNIKFEVIFA